MSFFLVTTTLITFSCLIIASCTITSTETTSSVQTNFNPWNWDWPERNDETLTQIFSDDHVTIYFDPGVNSSITWPFATLSTTWKYTKDTYGPFGPDPHLYVILRSTNQSTQPSYGCETGIFLDAKFDFRNVISCTSPTSGSRSESAVIDIESILNDKEIDYIDEDEDQWAVANFENVERLLGRVSTIVNKGAKGMRNWADLHICGGGMRLIVMYDLLLQVLGQNSEEVIKWRLRMEKDQVGRSCFRDWFLPIYNTYGNGGTLNLDTFFNYTNFYWPRNSQDYWFMNTGEFIHFWSGAVTADLTELSQGTFGLESEELVEIELVQAKRQFPYFNYTGAIIEPCQSQNNTAAIVVGALAVAFIAALVTVLGIKLVGRFFIIEIRSNL